MSKGINIVILIGNLGQDPEIRYTSNNNIVANIVLATSDSWRDKQTGEIKEKTEWHRVVLFGRLAEITRDFLKKGAQVYIQGSLHTRKWQDQQGNDKYITEIIVNAKGSMQMLTSKQNTNLNQSIINKEIKKNNNLHQKENKLSEKLNETINFDDDDITF